METEALVTQVSWHPVGLLVWIILLDSLTPNATVSMGGLQALLERPVVILYPGVSLSRGLAVLWPTSGWLHGTVVERRSLAGELSLSCARPAADG